MKNQALIEELEKRVQELERKANPIIETINGLRAEDGLPPRSPFGGGGGHSGDSFSGGLTPTQIKPDTFYGKKLQTAVREYLEMRKISAGGATSPATPREIYEAITEGGFQFDAKTADIAMVGLRALLRKRTAFFHKLPNGTYGLTNWYEHTKKPKQHHHDDDDEKSESDDEKETATTKKGAAA